MFNIDLGYNCLQKIFNNYTSKPLFSTYKLWQSLTLVPTKKNGVSKGQLCFVGIELKDCLSLICQTEEMNLINLAIL